MASIELRVCIICPMFLDVEGFLPAKMVRITTMGYRTTFTFVGVSFFLLLLTDHHPPITDRIIGASSLPLLLVTAHGWMQIINVLAFSQRIMSGTLSIFLLSSLTFFVTFNRYLI
jgi:hypothetical protein